MTVTDAEVRQIFTTLAEISADVRALKEAHREAQRTGRPECAAHATHIDNILRRLSILEAAAGKEKFATAVIGATAAAFVLLAKFLLTKAG